jgi:hypothetical protein
MWLGLACGCNALFGIDELAGTRGSGGSGGSAVTAVAAGGTGGAPSAGAGGMVGPGGGGLGGGGLGGGSVCAPLSDDEQVHTYAGHCYRLVPGSTDFANAETKCVGWGGHLVAPSTNAEHLELEAFLTGVGIAGYVWIGATDQASEGTFVWLNGESWGETHWASNQPDASDPSLDCVAAQLVPSWLWTVHECTFNARTFCERPL